ncbi:N-acetylmuramoyl-L-alanine amidase family protein [Paenibacillus hamazuiensis]|uniref:N-acetylmuramoyl-L-alanine amidase family protein n=1 Tax=Paenibacillus hamazuiensis TaxID=2936508 RepID=UPI00200D676D|nr:N-acetylmuramoyl-L-alanine amidase family protein [Paenibacillus hamazuiensis]
MRFSFVFFALFVTLSILLFPVSAGAAVQPIQLFLNGKQLTAEVAPRIVKEGTTIVPVRIIAEELGAKVQWDGDARKVTVKKEQTNIELSIDQPVAVVNNAKVALEAAPAIVEGNTMLPLRFVSEQLGVKVTWDELTRSVFLFKNAASASEPQNADASDKSSQNAAQPVASRPAVSPPNADQPNANKPNTGQPNSGQPNTNGQNTNSQNASPQNEQPSAKPIEAIGPKPAEQQNPQNLPNPAAGKPETGTPDKPAGSVGNGVSDKPAGTTGNGTAGGGAATSSDAAAKPGTAAGAKPEGTKPAEEKTIVTVQGISLNAEQIIVKTSANGMKPNITKLKNPDRLVVDFPYAQLDPSLKVNADKQGEIAVDHPAIQKIRYSLFSTEPSIVRMVIDLKSKIVLKPADSKQTNQFVFDVKPAPKYKVVIDAGHGDKDTGAVSATGRYEKDFTLSMVTKVANLLEKEKDIEVVMTRKDDTFLELAERVAVANDAEADLFLSIHANKFSNATIRGIETYYSRKESESFANIVHRQALAGTGLNDRRVRQSDFYVIKHTTMPAVLLECGYLSNKEEESLLYQDAFQNKLAASIVAAIVETLNSN